jgi:histidinol phosphatase-like enzyme
MTKKNILICIDRDGTMIYDGGSYHLGQQRNWKKLIKFLRGVNQGIKELRKINKVKIYMITNQPGPAIKEFPLLNEKRAIEVCEYLMKLLKEKGAKLDGYELCGKASLDYVKRRKDRYTFDKKLVGNFSCAKPKPGMVYNALKKEGWNKKNTKIYVIGDRLSDVQCGINAGGLGIFVPFSNKPKEIEKVKKIKSKKKYISKTFLDACKFIKEKESQI